MINQLCLNWGQSQVEFICGYFHGVLDKILIFIALKELLKSSHILNFHDHPRQSIDIHYWELQKGPKISVINSLKMIGSKKQVVRRTAKASAIFLRGLKIHETSGCQTSHPGCTLYM